MEDSVMRKHALERVLLELRAKTKAIEAKKTPAQVAKLRAEQEAIARLRVRKYDNFWM